MKVVGLIAEYNPFHNGHFYHIQKAREITGADAVLVVMSGNYVQRGTPAIMPKHLRARMALLSGASAVIELPVPYATGSAEYFATGAVSLLNQLGCIHSICFGSECGNIDILTQTARIIEKEPDEYKKSLHTFLREGLPFPAARQHALNTYLNTYLGADYPAAVLEQPNNILGIEYLKALYQSDSTIKAYTIRRMESGYHDKDLSEQYSSASAIRSQFENSNFIFSRLEEQLPASSMQILKDTYGVRYPVHANDFSLLLKQKLLLENKNTLTQYLDVTKDIAHRIIRLLNDYKSFEQFCGLLKTKDMTYTRISRCLLHILLGITKNDMETYRATGACQYAHILGFREDSTELLSLLKKHSRIPLLTKLTQTDTLTDVGTQMLRQDIYASDLYESVVTDKYQTPFINEYKQQVIKV